MLPIVTNQVAGLLVGWCVCQSRPVVSPPKTAELIDTAVHWAQVSSRNHVSDGVQMPHVKGQF